MGILYSNICMQYIGISIYLGSVVFEYNMGILYSNICMQCIWIQYGDIVFKYLYAVYRYINISGVCISTGACIQCTICMDT